ncbi:MAG: acyltransferase 3 [Lacunisphaera sp.]|nr:acyltransferase 3 [Lacunisphaera sp.]
MVDCFFILSGFVICHSYGNKIQTGTDSARFLWFRIGRLYPLHFALIFVALAMECAKYYAEKQYGIVSVYGAFVATNEYSFVTNLLLIHDWGFNNLPSYNTPSWSISAEVFVNIVFCLILFVTKSSQKLVMVSVAIIIFSGSAIIATGSLGLTAMMDCGVFRCLLGFFIGVLVYQIYRVLGKLKTPRAHQNGSLLNALPFVFGFLLVTFLSFKSPGGSDFLLLPIAACFLLFVVRAPGGPADRCLTSKPVSWLGKVSYSIYMVHYPILWTYLQIVRVLLKAPVILIGQEKVPMPNWIVSNVLLICAIGTVLIVSHFSFKWIEEPFRIKSKKLAARWFPASDAQKATETQRWTPSVGPRAGYGYANA